MISKETVYSTVRVILFLSLVAQTILAFLVVSEAVGWIFIGSQFTLLAVLLLVWRARDESPDPELIRYDWDLVADWDPTEPDYEIDRDINETTRIHRIHPETSPVETRQPRAQDP